MKSLMPVCDWVSPDVWEDQSHRGVSGGGGQTLRDVGGSLGGHALKYILTMLHADLTYLTKELANCRGQTNYLFYDRKGHVLEIEYLWILYSQGLKYVQIVVRQS